MLKNTLGYSFFFLLIGLYIVSDLRAGTGHPMPPGILRHYPEAGAVEVPSVTSIGITASKPFDESVTSALEWKVIGSRSGVHAGSIVLSDDRRTAIFKPVMPFDLADTVSVALISSNEDGVSLQCSFSFVTCILPVSKLKLAEFSSIGGYNPPSPSPDTIMPPPPPDTLPPPPPDSIPGPPQDSLPPLPNWGMTTITDNNPAPGLIFLSIIPGAMPGSLLILDEHSNILFGFPGIVSDFVRQQNGLMTFFGLHSLYYGIDTLGNILKSYGCTNGVTAEGHELIVANGGGYTLLGLDTTSKDMSYVAGNSKAIIEGGNIQTFDSSGNLIFWWRGIDHFNVTDDVNAGDMKGSVIDFEHANSIDIDSDGNYLLSSRNLSEITKINGATGDIIWRFGGNHNQFKLVGDNLGISCQHYAKWLKNGDIMLFDNGVYHPTPESRAVEYQLDTNNMTATLKWQFHHSPPIYTEVMGDAERLDNGNTFIGWGSNPSTAATEVDSNGKVVYEMNLSNYYSYRALKYTFSAPQAPASVSSAIQPQQTGLSLSLSPSATGYDLSVSSATETVSSISLYDAAGRVVQHVFDGNISSQPKSISLSTGLLPNGTYFCLLTSSQGNIARPFSVLK